MPLSLLRPAQLFFGVTNSFRSNGCSRLVLLPSTAITARSSVVRSVQTDTSNTEHQENSATGATDASSTRKEDGKGESFSELRQRIFIQTLKHVKELGFSSRAVSEAVHALQLPPTLVSLFRDGGDLGLYFYADGNRQTRDFMHRHLESVKAGTERKLRMNEFIRVAIVHRINVTRPYAEHWPKVMLAIAARPRYTLTALERLSELVDDVWYAAGDRSLDSNWYTKRALLAAVYKASELYMLSLYLPTGTSTPTDQEATERINVFVQKRLDDVMVVGGAIRSAQSAVDTTLNVGYAAASVAANILGVQRPRSY